MGSGFYNKVLPLISLTTGLVLWQVLLSSTGEYNLIPTPCDVVASLVELIQSGELWLHFKASAQRLIPGWITGVLAGWGAGLLIGLSDIAYRLLLPWLALLFPVPKIALLPVFILLFGIGEASQIATVFVAVFFPVVYCVWQGVWAVPSSLVDMGKCFGLPKTTIIRHIIIPGSLPGVLLACRLTTPLSLIILLAAEMLGAEYGVGALIMGAGAMAQLDQLFAGVAVLSCSGIVMFYVWGLIEKRCLHWRGELKLL